MNFVNALGQMKFHGSLCDFNLHPLPNVHPRMNRANGRYTSWLLMVGMLILSACASQVPTPKVPVEIYDFPVGGNPSRTARITLPQNEPINPPQLLPSSPGKGKLGDSSSVNPRQDPSPNIPIFSYPKSQLLANTPENRALMMQDLGNAAVDIPKITSNPSVATIAPVETAPASADTPAKAMPDKSTEKVAFNWPVKGTVIRKHGEKSAKGIDIAGKLGEAVLATADGSVTYIGMGLRGYGNLIVVRHDSGFLSVYAHVRKILVKENDRVKRGQTIAELGDTEADRPKLLFQLRQGRNSLDPQKYLPVP
jgi:murein DD-endopeptidase MepM/ murein hydrolase activator NlpD